MDKAEPYNEIQRLTEIERAASGKPSHSKMDAAFCARMHAAIAAGLESAPTKRHHYAWNKKPQSMLSQVRFWG